MTNKLKVISAAMIMSAVMSLNAFAAVDVSSALNTGVSESDLSSAVISAGATTDSGAFSDADVGDIGKFKIGGTSYYYKMSNEDAINSAVKDKAKAAADKKAANENISDEARNKLNNTNGLNITADIEGGAGAMRGFAPLIQLIMGIFVWLATVGLTFFTAFDVVYLSFPKAKGAMDAAGSGSGLGAGESKSGGPKFRFITDEAVKAYEESQKTGKNPFTIYLFKRMVVFIALPIVIFILLTGNITILINIALRFVNGILTQLKVLSV